MLSFSWTPDVTWTVSTWRPWAPVAGLPRSTYVILRKALSPQGSLRTSVQVEKGRPNDLYDTVLIF